MLVMAILACYSCVDSPLAWAQTAPVASTDPTAPEPVSEIVVVKGKFIVPSSKSAMKLDMSVRDTPFSVSSYSDAFMKAVETTNVAELYSYMTGVTRTGTSGYDLNMRGFGMAASDRNAILVDGLPGLAGRFGSPPTAAVDHIELVKGPASVLYGQAQPGGFVNILPKRPQAEKAIVFDLKGSAYMGDKLGLRDATGYNASLDATGPVGEGTTLLYRFVLDRGDRDLFRDNTYEKTVYVSPSLTWNIDKATSSTLQIEHREAKNAYDNLLVAPNLDVTRVAPITTFYQQPGDFRTEASNSLSLFVNHLFDHGVKWNFGARVVRHQDDSAGYDQVDFITTGVSTKNDPCNAASPCLRMRARVQHNEREYNFYDTNFSLPFTTGAIGHKVLVGVAGGQEISDFDRRQFSNGPASCATATTLNCLTSNIYDPSYNLPALSTIPLIKGTTPRTVTTSYSTGFYASDAMTLSERWKAMAGLRYSIDRQRIIPDLKSAVAVTKYKQNEKLIPMAGLLFEPNNEWTFYTSYATSYVPAPATAQDAQGNNPFKPESAVQYEVGTKVRLPKGRVTATVALFRIDKKDALLTFSCPIGTCTGQVGGARSQGVEAEVNTRLQRNWQVAAGYAYTDAKYLSAIDPALVGARLINTPRQSAHLWSKYDFTGVADGWGLGMGVNAVGARTGTLPSSKQAGILALPGYVVVDFGVYHSIGDFDFTLKLNNALDRAYMESASFAGELGINPGAPRNLQVSMRRTF